MTTSFTAEALVEVLGGDREIVERLIELGVLASPSGSYTPDDAEDVRVARLLVRELEVNWPGVEVILRLRSELLVTRRQLAELARRVRSAKE